MIIIIGRVTEDSVHIFTAHWYQRHKC